MPSEKSKMLAGALYDPADPELKADRSRARELCRLLRICPEQDIPGLLASLLGAPGPFAINPPFSCDYGYNIKLAADVYLNSHCILLDVCRISIGARTLLGPGVSIFTAIHPMNAELRSTGVESGKPVTIEEDCWIGGGAIICAGVTVGARTVIGAGSVVTRDIGPDVFAAGNPCRVIRTL
jgi:maltose O-acetyltransferase